MRDLVTALESYLIQAEEGFIDKITGTTHTMYIGTYPDTKAHKYESLLDFHKASTQIVYKSKLNALLSAALIYGNTIDRKTNTVTLTPNSMKSLLDKKITLYEVKCKKIEFYKYNEKSPTDCYTVAGKDILAYSEIGEYKVSDIFKRADVKIQNKEVSDNGDRQKIIRAFTVALQSGVSSDKLLKDTIVINTDKLDHDDFIDGDTDSLIIAHINGPRDPDELVNVTNAVDKLISSTNTVVSKIDICKNWKVEDDWSKNEGLIAIEKK